MIKSKNVIIPILIFDLVYTMLLLPWINANRIFAEFFCSVGNFLFKDFPHGGFVNLKTQTDKGENDIPLFISKAEWTKGTKIKGVTTDKASEGLAT